MKILIDIGHPGHVHLFRPFAQKMISKRNQVLFTYREKEFEVELLEQAGFDYVRLGDHYKTIPTKLFGLLKFNTKLFFTALKFKPDFFLSHGSMYAAQVAFLTGKPHISLQDSENMEQIRLLRPFTKLIISPESIIKNIGKRVVKYRGYHVLNYLHPDEFQPNPDIYDYLNIPRGSSYFILRLVGLTATHDRKLVGLSDPQIKKLIEILSAHGKVFISSEKPLIDEYEPYRTQIPPHRMHDAIAYSKFLIGESGVMTSEAAILGVPNLLMVNGIYGVHEQQVKEGIKLHYFKFDDQLLNKVQEILENYDEVKKQWEVNSKKVIESCINLTDLIIWTLENYPDSVEKLLKIKVIKNEDYV